MPLVAQNSSPAAPESVHARRPPRQADSDPGRGDGHDGPRPEVQGGRFPRQPIRRPPAAICKISSTCCRSRSPMRFSISIGNISKPAADIIETNTFGATSVAMADFGLESHVREVNLAACALARTAADEMTRRTPDRPRFVAGSIGPTNKQLSIAGNVSDPAYRRPRSIKWSRPTTSKSMRWSPAASIFCSPRRPSTRSCSKPACLRSTNFHRAGRAAAGDGVVHDVRRRPHAVGSNGRSLLDFDRQRRSAQRRHQLRVGAGKAAALYRRAVAASRRCS